MELRSGPVNLYGTFFCGQRSPGSKLGAGRIGRMKIAVAALRREENSAVSPRSGRSKFYLVFDENGTLLEVLSNPFSRGGGGAGFGVAKMLADKKVDIVIGSQIGAHMEEALKRRGLKYYERTGSAKDAVARIIAQEKEEYANSSRSSGRDPHPSLPWGD